MRKSPASTNERRQRRSCTRAKYDMAPHERQCLRSFLKANASVSLGLGFRRLDLPIWIPRGRDYIILREVQSIETTVVGWRHAINSTSLECFWDSIPLASSYL